MKHVHRPTDDRVLTHRGLVVQCDVCGRSIIWIAQTPNRRGYWRTF